MRRTGTPLPNSWSYAIRSFRADLAALYLKDLLLLEYGINLTRAVIVGFLIGGHQFVDLVIELSVVALEFSVIPDSQKLSGEQTIGFAIR